MDPEIALAVRLRLLNRLNKFGLGILAIGLVLAIGNFARIFVTIPRLGLFVGAVGGSVMLIANLLFRQAVARAKTDKTNLEPANPRSVDGFPSQRSSANAVNESGSLGEIGSNLTRDERRYAIVMLYLSQFAAFHTDFFKALDVLDKTTLVSMPDSNQGRKRFFDSGVNAAISIGNGACLIQLIGTELDKFAGPVEAALTAFGGSASIKKVEPFAYAGQFVKEGEAYNVQVTLDTTGEKPMLSAGIWRIANA